MSDARRTLRIPDAVNRSVRARQGRDPLWYVGALQTENGQDVQFERPEGDVGDAPTEPLSVRPSGLAPDESLDDDDPELDPWRLTRRQLTHRGNRRRTPAAGGSLL